MILTAVCFSAELEPRLSRQMSYGPSKGAGNWEVGIRKGVAGPNFTAMALISFKKFRLFLSTQAQLALFSPCQSVCELIFISRMVSHPCMLAGVTAGVIPSLEHLGRLLNASD